MTIVLIIAARTPYPKWGDRAPPKTSWPKAPAKATATDRAEHAGGDVGHERAVGAIEGAEARIR